MKNQSYLSAILVAEEMHPRFRAYLVNLHEVLEQTYENYEVIIVCNGPSASLNSETIQLLKSYRHSTVLVQLSHAHSPEIAGYLGLEYAKGDFVLEIEHLEPVIKIEHVRLLESEAKKGNDVVSMVPQRNRAILPKLFYKLLNNQLFIGESLGTEYMRLVTRRALNAVFQVKQRTKYRKLLYAYTGFKKTKVFDPEQTDYHGSSVWNRRPAGRIGLATDVLISHTTIVMRATMLMALLCLLMSAGGGVYALLIYVFKDATIEGWTTLMLFVSAGLSGVFLILSMIVKYLELILRETQSGSLYTIESVSIVENNQIRPHV